ncbi:MAG: DUF4188 domain-containing protein [Pseudomonadota bacterium]
MFSASFIFTERELDAEFFELDGLIARAAEETDGFLGKESWVSADGTRRNAVYYWRDRAALRHFSRHPLHVKAKRQYERWYGGFHVVVAEVVQSYGDGALSHSTPNQRQRAVGQ